MVADTMTADPSLYQLLSQFWLREPDADALARIHAQAGLSFDGDPSALATAYADLFLLNVYPYGTAYTDEWGELNTPEARETAALYARHAYQPRELTEVGAPDHLGLCLGFLAHRPRLWQSGKTEEAVARFLDDLIGWSPVCCLAAERDPSAHPFYQALARLTRETILANIAPLRTSRHAPLVVTGYQPGEELRLRDVVRFLLIPARCGMFLSRSRLGALALALGTRLPFGARFDVAQWLFTCAGEGGQIDALLRLLRAEADEWSGAYRVWAEQWTTWQKPAAQWLARLEATRRLLDEMARLAREGVAIEYANPADDQPPEPYRQAEVDE